jgi:ABC-type antimicrobial peptide transport system ATPase subunit
MVATLARPALDVAAGGLIRAWLLKKQKAVLVDFLDALGIKHEDGVVENLPAEMDDAKLKSAVAALLARHPQEVVAVYLNAFNEMNEANWANLKTMLESDPRLQLGATKA